MKYILIFCLITYCIPCSAQAIYELRLSETLNEDRTGVWTKGDYKVLIGLSVLGSIFQGTAKTYADALVYYDYPDTATATYYMHTARRYQLAADQLANAENGFQLGKLILYAGADNEKQNKEYSLILANTVKHMVENGKAAVYYKGTRIFTLKQRSEAIGTDILNHGYEDRIYFDDPENYLFQDIRILGW